MKNSYEGLEISVILLTNEDIVTASLLSNNYKIGEAAISFSEMFGGITN